MPNARWGRRWHRSIVVAWTARWLLDTRDSLALRGTTAVVVTIDHGHSPSDHGWLGTPDVPLFDVLARTPRFVWYPGRPLLGGRTPALTAAVCARRWRGRLLLFDAGRAPRQRENLAGGGNADEGRLRKLLRAALQAVPVPEEQYARLGLASGRRLPRRPASAPGRWHMACEPCRRTARAVGRGMGRWSRRSGSR